MWGSGSTEGVERCDAPGVAVAHDVRVDLVRQDLRIQHLRCGARFRVGDVRVQELTF